MCAGHRRARGSLGQYWVNLRDSDLPLPRKLWVAGANYWRRVQLHRGCCGHYGEPGC